MPTSSAVAQVRIVDGDTIDFDGTTYSILGVDELESVQTCGSALGEWHCGQAATAEMVKLADREQVTCKLVDREVYAWILAACWVGEIDLGEAMFSADYAWAFVKYFVAYVE